MSKSASHLKVLHVLSQYELTGAETYAISLAEYQRQQGYKVWFISDNLSTPTDIGLLKLKVSKRDLWQRLYNIWTVRKFLRKNKIDVVHAHSRAASWVCFFAIQFLKIPLVSTVHGKQHLHSSSRRFNIYGSHLIAICENLKTHLVRDLNIPEQQVSVVRNPFHLNSIKPIHERSRRISLIGRASNTKGDRACELLDRVFLKLMSEFPALKIRLVGGEFKAFKKHNQIILQKFFDEFGDRFELPGFIKDLNSVFESSGLVIAAGRTAVEALYSGNEVLAFGEGQSHGIIGRLNFTTCLNSNFGDCSISSRDSEEYEKIAAELRQWMILPHKKIDSELKPQLEKEFAVENIFEEIENIYLKSRMKKLCPHSIPILMYHRVVEIEPKTKHKTFVLKEVFEKQLQSLRTRNYTSLNFQDYEKFRRNEIAFSRFPKRPIMLNFDDAYTDNLGVALPLLKKYNFKATLFCLSDHSIKENFWDQKDGEVSPIMSESQKREAALSGHFEIASHGVSHSHLTHLNPEDLSAELLESKRSLEKLSEEEVLAFAYPFGIANPEVKKAVAGAGYRYAVLTDRGAQHIEDEPFSIFRINMFPNDQGLKFWRKTQWWYRKWYDYSRKTNRPS